MNDSPWVADMTTLGNQRLLLTAKGVGKSVLIFRFDLRAFMKTVVTVIAAPESKNRACRLSSE